MYSAACSEYASGCRAPYLAGWLNYQFRLIWWSLFIFPFQCMLHCCYFYYYYAFPLSPFFFVCLFCFTYCFHLFLEEKKADPENGDTGRETYSKHFCTFALKSFDLRCLSECVSWNWIKMLIYFCDFKVHIRKWKLRKDFPKCNSFAFLREAI